MMLRKGWYAACAVVIFSGLGIPCAQAQAVSPMKAGRFLQYCTNPAGAKVCDAYIVGMTDAEALAMALNKHRDTPNVSPAFCVPVGTRGVEIRKKVVAWFKSHNSDLNNTVGEVVYTALHEIYPCKRKSSAL